MKFASLLIGLVATASALSACASPRDSMPAAIEIYPDAQVAALAEASCRGDRDEMERLISQGVDVNARGIDNSTPLFYAEICQNLEGVTFLLKNGADANAKADNEFTPVLVATQFEDSQLLKAIIEHGGDVNVRRKQESALSRAFDFGIHTDKWENYHLLLDNGADYRAPATLNSTFLEYISGVFARFGEAQRLYEMGFEGDLDSLIRTVEVSGGNLLPTPEREREIFLAKLYADRDARDRAAQENPE